MVGIGSKSDHAPPFACSVKTIANANCPHRTHFYFVFLPAPIAADEMSLVHITTPFSILENLLYDTFREAIAGIIFNRKSHTFLQQRRNTPIAEYQKRDLKSTAVANPPNFPP